MDISGIGATIALLVAVGGYYSHKSWINHFGAKASLSLNGSSDVTKLDAVSVEQMYEKYVSWVEGTELPTKTAFGEILNAMLKELSRHKEFTHHFTLQEHGVVFKNTRTLSTFYFQPLAVKVAFIQWVLSLSTVERGVILWAWRDVINRVPQHATALQDYSTYAACCGQLRVILQTKKGVYLADGFSNLLYLNADGRFLSTKLSEDLVGATWVSTLLSPCSEWQRAKFEKKLASKVVVALEAMTLKSDRL